MKIGIIGAPGAGKSDFARELATKLSLEDGQQSHIIDDYIKEIEDEHDLVFGFMATYIGNLLCALGRFKRERMAEKDKVDHIITCGTTIETMVYAAVDGVNMERYSGFKEDHIKRSALTMQMLGLFTIDLMQYDKIFYLPYAEDAEVEPHLIEFDKNIPVLLEMWEREHIKLEGEDRVEVALTIVREESVEATATE